MGNIMLRHLVGPAANPETEHVFSPGPPLLALPALCLTLCSDLAPSPLRHATPPPCSNYSWTGPSPNATPSPMCSAPSVCRVCPPLLTCPNSWSLLPDAQGAFPGPPCAPRRPGPTHRSGRSPATPLQSHHALDLSPATSPGKPGLGVSPGRGLGGRGKRSPGTRDLY